MKNNKGNNPENMPSHENQNTTNMAKTHPGTSKPSGAGVGKGGPKTSPTTGTGGTLKPGKGKGKKKM